MQQERKKMHTPIVSCRTELVLGSLTAKLTEPVDGVESTGLGKIRSTPRLQVRAFRRVGASMPFGRSDRMNSNEPVPSSLLNVRGGGGRVEERYNYGTSCLYAAIVQSMRCALSARRESSSSDE